jgi:L-asparaginase
VESTESSEVDLPRVTLLALGGTIAAPVDASGRGATLGIDAAGLVAAIPELAAVATVSPTTFRTTMSAALLFEDVLELAARIEAEADAGANGIVITMGTDSLEEVAYALELIVTTTIPVVVTGAMRNAGRPGADGPANLLAALRVAASPAANDLGVLVVLEDEVHLARAVRKMHTSSPHAFASPGLGPVGWVTEDRVRVVLVPRAPRDRVAPSGQVPAVALVRLSLGDDGRMLGALTSLGYVGAVIEVFGAGHVGAGLMPALRALAEEMPVVFASRTGAGELYRETGAFPGSERDLQNAGLIPAGALDGLKARILLALLLASDRPRGEILADFVRAAEG